MPRPLHVLLLEDRQDDARLILHELRRAGFDPVGERVETEADFLDRLERGPDLVLADFNLPGFDALRALRLVRERGLDVPVIVITGTLGDEVAVECVKEGAADYLIKDRLARLGTAVTRALEQRQARADRRHAEATNALLAAVVESSDDSIISEDLGGVVLTWNDGARRIFGYAPDETVGRSLASILIHPDGSDEVRELFAMARRGEPVRNFETRRAHKDGRVIDVSLTISPIRDPAGEIVGVSQIYRDITERRRDAERIRQNERELVDFFENATVGLNWVGPDGTILRVNRAELEMLGYTREEYLGRHVAEFHVDQGLIAEILLRLGSGETLRDCPARLRCKDGTIRDVLIDSNVLWEDGRFVHSRCFTRDVTERNRAEAARLESERMARSILDSLSSNIAVLDERGVILAVNRAWIDFAERNGAVHNYAEGANYFAVCGAAGGEGESSEFAMGIREVLDGRRASFSLEYACHSPTAPRWCLGRVLPFLGVGPRRVIVDHQDITERKLAQEALRLYAERLENLRAIDAAILMAHSPEEIAGAALKQLARIVPCGTGGIVAYDSEREAFEVIAAVGLLVASHPPGSRFPHCLEDLVANEAGGEEDASAVSFRVGFASSPLMDALRPEGVRSAILLPLREQGRPIGLLYLGSEQPEAFTPTHVEVTVEVAGHLAVAISQALLHEDIREGRERLEALSRQLLRAQEDERRRIAHELHDEVGQCLVVAKMSVDRAAADPDSSRHHLAHTRDLILLALEQVRDLSRLLRPSALDHMGLAEALRGLVEGLADRASLVADNDIDLELGRIDPDVEIACYRIAQEALTNALKHARATRLSLTLRRVGAGLELEVADDGVGFDLDAALARAASGHSLGMLSLNERAELAGGHATVLSSPGHGTRIRVAFPALNRPDRAAGSAGGR